MSAVKNPTEKKRLAYERDHYSRGGQHNKAWRRIKPAKKAHARRAFRKKANHLTRVCATNEVAPVAAIRDDGSLRQQPVCDWGTIHLGELVDQVLDHRGEMVGARKRRKERGGQNSTVIESIREALNHSRAALNHLPPHRYLLIFQIPRESFSGQAALVAFEQQFRAALGEGDAVESHDSSSAEFNLFVSSDAPAESFHKVRSLLKATQRLSLTRVALRGGGSDTINMVLQRDSCHQPSAPAR